MKFHPGQVWLDTDGHPIQAHGGGLLHHDSIYYWYGENKDAPNVEGTSRVDVLGVSCYSSRDLFNWKNEGVVLPAVHDENHDLHPRNVLERPKVLFNAQTGKFVLWAHVDAPGYMKASTGVAVSDSPAGPFEYLRSFQPCGEESRDMTVWQDDDGSAYLFHSSEMNKTQHIVKLSDDYLDVSGDFVRAFPEELREAPAVWKYQGRYYQVTSYCTGWSPNPARWHVADHPMGPWQTMGDPCVGSEEECATTFRSQSTYVLPAPGREDAFIFCADRWDAQNLQDSRYVWLPLWMKNGEPRIEWRDEWDFSVFDES